MEEAEAAGSGVASCYCLEQPRDGARQRCLWRGSDRRGQLGSCARRCERRDCTRTRATRSLPLARGKFLRQEQIDVGFLMPVGVHDHFTYTGLFVQSTKIGIHISKILSFSYILYYYYLRPKNISIC